MQAREKVLKKVSEELQFDLTIVEEVISWSFKKANEATHSNKEVELSGIGKLQLSQSKLRKYIEKLEKMQPNLKEERHITSVAEKLEDLKTKIDVRKD